MNVLFSIISRNYINEKENKIISYNNVQLTRNFFSSLMQKNSSTVKLFKRWVATKDREPLNY